LFQFFLPNHNVTTQHSAKCFGTRSNRSQMSRFPRNSRAPCFRNPFRASTFDHHLQIDLHLHSGLRFQYWQAALSEFLRTYRFHPNVLLRTVVNRVIPSIVVLVLAFTAIFVSGCVLFDAVSAMTKPGYKAVEANAIGACLDKGIALCPKDQRLVDLPQHERRKGVRYFF